LKNHPPIPLRNLQPSPVEFAPAKVGYSFAICLSIRSAFLQSPLLYPLYSRHCGTYIIQIGNTSSPFPTLGSQYLFTALTGPSRCILQGKRLGVIVPSYFEPFPFFAGWAFRIARIPLDIVPAPLVFLLVSLVDSNWV
jgi:hypothetical protein